MTQVWLRAAGRAVIAGAVVSAICEIGVICVRRSIARGCRPLDAGWARFLDSGLRPSLGMTESYCSRMKARPLLAFIGITSWFAPAS